MTKPKMTPQAMIAMQCSVTIDRLLTIQQTVTGGNNLGKRECRTLIAECEADLALIRGKLEQMD